MREEGWNGKRVSIIGAARSGISAARFLTGSGAIVTLSDSQSEEKIGEERIREARSVAAQFIPEATTNEALPENTDLVVTSPGVPKTAAVLQEAVRRGISVISEIELAFSLTDTPIAAVTGTNGKTTTTILTAQLLEAARIKATIAGNVSADEIKQTLVDAAWETLYTEEDIKLIVAEISSFQLEWVHKFAPCVAILTNITPDHLNRHASFEEYIETKARIFAAQTENDLAIINDDNEAAKSIGDSWNKRGYRGNLLWFSRTNVFTSSIPAAFVDNGVITVRLKANGEEVAILPVSELPPSLPGNHSVENVLAASAAALFMGASPEAIAQGIREFKGVAHRMEWVAEHNRVAFINNSMCTNTAAAVSSLSAMSSPTIVIAGGVDKESDFADLVPVLHSHAKHLILIGRAADKMEQTFRAGGYDKISRAETMQDAVNLARSFAVPGDAVLLSPACASFDMFADFEARGIAFRDAVRAIINHGV